MKSEEIRSKTFESDSGAWEAAKWLQEIAAQLADLNESIRHVIADEKAGQ